MIITDLVYTEGTGEGAVSGEKIYDYMGMSQFQANGQDLRVYLTDPNLNGAGDFGDIVADGVTVPYFDQSAYQIEVTLVGDAGYVSELNGDSFTFSITFESVTP